MEKSGINYAFLFDGQGGGTSLGWDEIRQWTPEKGILWVHLDYSAEDSNNWILNESDLDEVSSAALLTEETRPRATDIGDALLIALRGINLNPGADAEDMVAIRIWTDSKRIITTRKRRLLSAMDVADALKSGKGPRTCGEFLVELTNNLISRMEGAIENLEDRMAEIEEKLLTTESYALRSDLSEIRRESIMLRRFLAPQREAMNRLYSEKVSWINDTVRLGLREATDRLIRYIEDLDAVRDRASVTQEELANRLSEQMNSRMYVLSLVAAIFLPLGFLTGLLGINVAGIPGAENKWAFSIFIILLIIVVFLQMAIFKKKKWL